jgi:hypothetical protein
MISLTAAPAEEVITATRDGSEAEASYATRRKGFLPKLFLQLFKCDVKVSTPSGSQFVHIHWYAPSRGYTETRPKAMTFMPLYPV